MQDKKQTPTDKSIKDIQKENSFESLQAMFKKQNERDKDKQSNTKTVAAGFLSGLASGAVGTFGLLSGLAEPVGVGLFKALHKNEDSEKVPFLETSLEAFSDDPILNKASELDTKTREILGAKQFEELAPKEQALDIVGSLINPKGILKKIPGVEKAATGIKKAITTSAKNKAVQKAVQSGTKTLGDLEKIGNKAEQKASNVVDFATNLTLPGLQVSKNAGKLQKAVEIGTQTGLPVAMNEATRYGLGQEGILGDYRDENLKQNGIDITPITDDVEQITLLPTKQKIKAKKYKNYSDVKDMEGSYQVTIDKDAINHTQEKNSKIENTAKLTGLAITAAFGAPLALRGLKKVSNKFVQDPIQAELAKQINQTSKPFEDTIPLLTKIDNEVADKFAWSRVAEEQKLINKDVVSSLSRDIGSEIDSAFNTGKVQLKNTDVDFGISPQQVWNELDNLEKTDPKSYEVFNQFLDLNSQIQDETNKFNLKNIHAGPQATELSPQEYLKQRLETPQRTPEGLTTSKDLVQKIKTHQNLRKLLDSNPVTKQIVNDVSKISNGLLDLMQKSGMYTAKQIESMRKNRTIMNELLYYPRVADTKIPLKDRFTKMLISSTPKQNNIDNLLFGRGEFGDIKKVKSYKDVLESHIKDTLRFIINNEQKSEVLDLMAVNSLKRASDRMDYIKTNPKTYLNLSDKSALTDINNQLVVREIGKANTLQNSKDIVTSGDKSFFTMLNEAGIDKQKVSGDVLDIEVNERFSQNAGDVKKALLTRDHDDTIMSTIKDGYETFYKVPKIIKYSFDIDNKLPSTLAEGVRAFRNFRQYAITGKVADPMFSFRSMLYTTQENVGALKTIAENAGIKNPSTMKYLKEFSSASKELYAHKIADLTATDITKDLVKSAEDSGLDNMNTALLKSKQDEIRAKINNMLLTKVQEQGANLSKPINKTKSGTFYTMNTNESSISKVKNYIFNNNTAEKAKKMLAYYNIFQDVIREAPQYAMLRYLGRESGAIVNGQVKDLQKLRTIISDMGKYTASSSKRGSYRGLIGNVANVIYNYIPYGNITIQSVASKSRLLKDALRNSQYAKVLNDALDLNVRNIDILKGTAQSLKNISKSKYFEGMSAIVLTPSIVEYSWNYSNQDNANDYAAMSDYERAGSFVLVNFFGKGKHLRVPMDQEYAVFKSILQNYIDTYMQGTSDQYINPSLNYSSQTAQSLARSLQLDPEGLMSLGANVGGYTLDFGNLYKDEKVIQEIQENKLEKGTGYAQRRQILNTALGKFGNWINTFYDENNQFKQDLPVSLRAKNTVEGMVDNLTKAGTLWSSSVNVYNDTNKYVMDTYKNYLDNRETGFFSHLVKDKITNQQQQQAYNFIKSYKRNRLDPIMKKWYDINGEMRLIRVTSKNSNGTMLDYNGRKQNVNELSKQLQDINSLMYNELKYLDILLEQQYGKDINMKNFIEKLQGE